MNVAVRALVVALLLLCPAPAPAFAQGPQDPASCARYEQVVAAIAAQMPIKRIVKLDPAQTADVVTWFNRLPPESDDKFDFAAVVLHENGKMGVLLGNGDSVCVATLLPDELAAQLMRAIEGTRAGAGT